MRALFIGSVEFSRGLLAEVRKKSEIEIVGLVTKEKSKFNSDFFDLSADFAPGSCPEVFYFKNDLEKMSVWVKEKKPDIIFCFGWSHLLPAEVIALSPGGVIGYHPSALPANRGRHPIIWALALGLDRTASSFFFINSEVDDGDIISQKEVLIRAEDYAMDLYKNLEKVAVLQLREILSQLVEKKLIARKQSALSSNHWRKRSEVDGKIDWRMSAQAIYNLVRALSPPYPGAFFQYGDLKIQVTRCFHEPANDLQNRVPGEVLRVSKGFVAVKAGEGLIKMKTSEIDVTLREGEFL